MSANTWYKLVFTGLSLTEDSATFYETPVTIATYSSNDASKKIRYGYNVNAGYLSYRGAPAALVFTSTLKRDVTTGTAATAKLLLSESNVVEVTFKTAKDYPAGANFNFTAS